MKQLFAILLVSMLSLFFVCCGDDGTGDIVPEKDKKEDETEKPAPLTEVPQSRIDRLTKGVNMAHWFAQTDISKANIESRFTQADYDFIKTSGFTYIRLSVNEEVVYLDPGKLNAAYLDVLDEAIQKFIDMDIAVLFDFHPNDAFKNKIHENNSHANNVKLFWGKMADHLSKFDPEFLYLEILNEPWTLKAEDWYAMQKTWVPVIRDAAPTHTIVTDANLRVTENDWDDVEAFTIQKPLTDQNIVYNLHFYAPMAFTHQGATWGWEALQHISGLEYPTDADNANSIKNSTNNNEAIWAMENYISDDWTKDVLNSKLKKVGDWSSQHNVPVTCNEFGVYYTAPNESKETYMKDMREILEAHNIGWAVWEYDEGFAIAENDGGTMKFKGNMKAVLGL